jgi:hypothetical protein
VLTPFAQPSPIRPRQPAYELLKTPAKADRPYNAILLWADVHNFFDDFQFGIDAMVCLVYSGIPTYSRLIINYEKDRKLYQFEMSGVPSIQGFTHFRRPPFGLPPPTVSATQSSIQDVDNALLELHFLICLQWHIAKGGRKEYSRAIYTSHNNCPNLSPGP